MEVVRSLPTQEELNRLWRQIDPHLPDFIFHWSASRKASAGAIDYRHRIVTLSIRHYLEYGMSDTHSTMRHEAAHYLAWAKYGDRGHGGWFWYYLGQLGGERYCRRLSANMREVKIETTGRSRINEYELDPATKTFRPKR
jgi:predicted SprT family Zn-dependent metalloprotease